MMFLLVPVQIFSENMGKKSEPQITKCKQGENWTKVTFKPDLAKFNMTHLEDDVVALMRKRVVDMAGTLGKTVKVELNGQRVPVKSFSDYVDLYLQSASMDGHELPRFNDSFRQTSVSVFECDVQSSHGGVSDHSHLSFFQGLPKGK